MWKMIITNTIIPTFGIVVTVLENIKVNGERLLSLKYRLWIFDYGAFLVVLQLIVLITSLFVWKSKNYRLVAVGIFVIWVLMELLMPTGPGVYD
jgi:hypothetical protein